MRILHTEWSDGLGGQEKRILAEMIGMQRRGHEVWLATRPSCAIGREATAAGISVRHFAFSGKFHLPSILSLARLIRANRIDIVNTHSGIDSWIGGLAAKLAGAALVRTRHLSLPLRRNWLNFVHYLPDRIVACGEALRKKLIEEHGFPARKVVSIPTGIDFATFAPRRDRAMVRAELGIPEADWLVLMVAVIRGVKRHEIALRAFAKLLPEAPNAWLVLCGDGPMRPNMEALARELGIAARTRFLGQRNDVADWMAAADALLLTSRSEGVPQAVSQAMGLGLPVVATAVGGVPELVKDGETGLLAPAEDAPAIAAALQRLHDDRSFASRLGQRARAHALERLGLDAMLDATETLYARVLQER